MMATWSQKRVPDEIDDDGLLRVRAYLLCEMLDHPGSILGEIQSDARAALQVQGDYRAAILLAHSASEVMLDLVLMLMMWEEDLTPEAAAPVFLRSLLDRVRSQYHSRLGGDWKTDETTIVGRWREKLVLQRHLVAHGGYRPSQQQAWEALDAHDDLRTYLFDRITERRNQYPITAGFMVSEAGLKRREGWTNKIRQILGQFDPEKLSEFNDWRSTVLQLRLR
jgi:hypothetical protein